jgi:uncharacterized membrane protein
MKFAGAGGPKPYMNQDPTYEPHSAIIARNIDALVAQRQQSMAREGWQEKLADRITRFTGSMLFVYLHLLIFGVWIAINIGWLPFYKFDPSLVILAMAASVEAIFLSTFVLISQNRMQALADQRADLNLHISLLAEHEVTQLIHLVSAIGRKLQVAEASDPDLDELRKDVKPEEVMEEMTSKQ